MFRDGLVGRAPTSRWSNYREVASSIPGFASSPWGERRWRSAKDPEWSMQPHGSLSRMLEKSGVRVKWGAVLDQRSEASGEESVA